MNSTHFAVYSFVTSDQFEFKLIIITSICRFEVKLRWILLLVLGQGIINTIVMPLPCLSICSSITLGHRSAGLICLAIQNFIQVFRTKISVKASISGFCAKGESGCYLRYINKEKGSSKEGQGHYIRHVCRLVNLCHTNVLLVLSNDWIKVEVAVWAFQQSKYLNLFIKAVFGHEIVTYWKSMLTWYVLYIVLKELYLFWLSR